MDVTTVLEIIEMLSNDIQDLEDKYLGYDEPEYAVQMQALEKFRDKLQDIVDENN